jgi:hypothetical protein
VVVMSLKDSMLRSPSYHHQRFGLKLSIGI